MREEPKYNDFAFDDGTVLRYYKGSILNIDGIPYEILIKLMSSQKTWIYDKTKAPIPEIHSRVGMSLESIGVFELQSEQAQNFLRFNRDFLVEEFEKEKHRENIFINQIMKNIK